MSILVKKKSTGIEYWITQEEWERLLELKLTKDYQRINPANSTNPGIKIETPNEVVQFIEVKKQETPVQKPKIKKPK